MEEQKKQVENFCNTGYVIRLGTDQYFREIRNRRIITAKIWKAAFFKSMKETEKFTEKHLWYVGMDPHEYYGAAEPPVRCGESHLSGLTEPPQFVY